MQDEKVTIKVAAKAIGVTPKTVHQWLRIGTLTRVKEGNRTYILMDEVRALRQNRVTNPKSEVITSEGKIEPSNNLGNNIVPIDREHYEGLLIRLGQLEANQQLLLEYRAGIESRDKALEQAKGNISAQAQELATVKTALTTNSAELDQARAVISKARSELEKMVELKQESEQKAKDLLDKQVEIDRLRAENTRLKLPFWRRWLKK
jgi:DNA-binding transcriptional MerR regulator